MDMLSNCSISVMFTYLFMVILGGLGALAADK